MPTAIRRFLIRVYNSAKSHLESILTILGVKSLLFRFLYRPDRIDFNKLTSSLENASASELLDPSISAGLVSLIKKNVFAKVTFDELASFLYGLFVYRKTGYTPQCSHNAFVSIFEKTNGLAQEIMHQSLFTVPSAALLNINPQTSLTSFKGDTGLDSLHNSLSLLKTDGYCILPFSLSANIFSLLMSEIAAMPFYLDKDKSNLYGQIDPASPPSCHVAHAQRDVLHSSKLIQGLLTHPLLLSLASAYLSADADLINSSLWYSFPAASPSSAAAQYFHYDLDTFKWLKLFIYLSDVDDSSGSHEYVPGSHLPGSKPASLLVRGYSRLSDAEVEASYPQLRTSITCPSGTIVFGDTRCYHKGNLPISGYRLALQGVYAPSTYSYNVV